MPTHALEFPKKRLGQTHPGPTGSYNTALNLSQKSLAFCDDQNWKGSEFPYALSFITFSRITFVYFPFHLLQIFKKNIFWNNAKIVWLRP
jgi:hypothetical protein